MSVYILKQENARERMKHAWAAARAFLEAGLTAKVTVELCQPTRSLEQNAKMWAMLGDIAQQVEWHVDGKLQKLPAEDWKIILTAGLKKNQRVAAGVEGGFVVLGESTSKMRVGEMAELITFLEWFGTERNVLWSNTDETRISEARGAA